MSPGEPSYLSESLDIVVNQHFAQKTQFASGHRLILFIIILHVKNRNVIFYMSAEDLTSQTLHCFYALYIPFSIFLFIFLFL